jgi:hypothetical protein
MLGNVLLSIHNCFVYKEIFAVLNSEHFGRNQWVYLMALRDGFLEKGGGLGEAEKK